MDNHRLLVSELGTFGHKNTKFGKILNFIHVHSISLKHEKYCLITSSLSISNLNQQSCWPGWGQVGILLGVYVKCVHKVSGGWMVKSNFL